MGPLLRQKNIKFDYFRVMFLPKTSPKDAIESTYDLRSIMWKWKDLSYEERLKPYKREMSRLERWDFLEEHKLYALQFCRLRDHNLPSVAKENEVSRPIDLEDDEFLSDKVSAIYDPKYTILMLQRNPDSLSRTAVEDYINKFSDSEEIIRLRPIRVPEARKKVEAAEFIKKIDIKFADLHKTNMSSVGTALKKWVLSFQELESVNAELILSVGRKKKNTLGLQKLRALIADIFNSKGIITSAEVAFKHTEHSNIEYVDLIDERLMDVEQFTYLPREEIEHEELIKEMLKKYYQRYSLIKDNFIPLKD